MLVQHSEFSFGERAAAKAASRAADEEAMNSGKVSRGDMARLNGGSLRKVRYNSSSQRIRSFESA